jgi:thiol-disulfide isomerase/thioredoxin
METGGFHNFTRVWRDNRVAIKVASNGHFEAVIPERSIGTWYIKTSSGIQAFDLVSGQTLVLIADFAQPAPLSAAGENADDFNYSSYSNTANKNYIAENNFTVKTRIQNIDSVLLYRSMFAVHKLELLENYRSGKKLSDKYYNWLVSKYKYEPYERTLVENIKNRDSLDASTISKLIQRGITDEYAALNTPEYNDLVDFYISTTFNRTKNPNGTLSDRFNFAADNNILTGSTKDVYLSRFMAWMIKTPDSIYAPLFTKYDALVHNKEMKIDVINRRNDYINPPLSSPAKIDTKRAASIAEILKKYKGKTIYVDFWASWCIPCRAEMPNAAALKQKLKGKNIVFLYFGYNDKEPAWLKARTQLEIEGEHYLLNEKMIKEADELFGINGIPHYAIIDKAGNIESRKAERPSDVYKHLQEILKK